ncbi:MAG TPA: TolC family protein [Terriglobales bacterium]|nr:TolC family protein [Terriglobales bacterium]
MNHRRHALGFLSPVPAAACLLVLLAALPVRAQNPLTLEQAVNIALEKNPVRKAALADQKAAGAGIDLARSALLPHLVFSESFLRGNDPIYVLSAKLRQQRFIAADLALPVLNTPPPINNFVTRFAVDWNLFDSGASWLNLSRSHKLQQAAGRQLDRTEQELVYRVVEAYDGLLLAAKQEKVAEDAVTTAQATLDQSRARYETGMTVESDLLSAQVELGERRQELIRARNDVELARARLDREMGTSFDSAYQPAEALAERSFPLAPLPELEREALEKRPDLDSLRLAESAQGKSVSAAKAAFGPRIDAFLGWETDNPHFTGGGGNNWVGGVEVQFDIFQGGAKLAALAQQKAYAQKVAALRESAESGVRLELRRAYLDFDASRQQVEVARASVSQAEESLRISQNRYQEGLTTITELLRAQEAARRSQAEYWQAVYRMQTSYAGLELAKGTLNSHSPVVTP